MHHQTTTILNGWPHPFQTIGITVHCLVGDSTAHPVLGKRLQTRASASETLQGIRIRPRGVSSSFRFGIRVEFCRVVVSFSLFLPLPPLQIHGLAAATTPRRPLSFPFPVPRHSLHYRCYPSPLFPPPLLLPHSHSSPLSPRTPLSPFFISALASLLFKFSPLPFFLLFAGQKRSRDPNQRSWRRRILPRSGDFLPSISLFLQFFCFWLLIRSDLFFFF